MMTSIIGPATGDAILSAALDLSLIIREPIVCCGAAGGLEV